MTVIWQLDNNNSNQRLIKKQDQIIIFEPLRFILLLSVN